LFRLVLESHNGRALGADSEEKHEPVSDIDTKAVDGLKVLDPNRPIREATDAAQRRAVEFDHLTRKKAPPKLS
jgi:hypothetical protein